MPGADRVHVVPRTGNNASTETSPSSPSRLVHLRRQKWEVEDDALAAISVAAICPV